MLNLDLIFDKIIGLNVGQIIQPDKYDDIKTKT